MPLQNRVTPFSELVAHPARGLLYGNRGCMHDDSGRICRRYGTRRWIACRLEFRGWERGPKLQPGQVHRALLPRRGDGVRGRAPALCALPARRLRAADASSGATCTPARPEPTRSTSSSTASASRRARARSGTTRRRFGDLPDGAFVLADGAAWLVLGPRLLRWTPAGLRGATTASSQGHRDRDHTALAGGRPALGLAAARAARASLIRGLRRSGSVRIGLSRQVSVNKRVISASVRAWAVVLLGAKVLPPNAIRRYSVMHTLQRRLRRSAGLAVVAVMALPLAAQAADYRVQLSESVNSGLRRCASDAAPASRPRQRRRRRARPDGPRALLGRHASSLRLRLEPLHGRLDGHAARHDHERLHRARRQLAARARPRHRQHGRVRPRRRRRARAPPRRSSVATT